MPPNNPVEKIKSGQGLTYSSSTDPFIKKGIINAIELFSGRRKVQRLYRELEEEKLDGAKLWMRIMEKLNIKLDYDQTQLSKIPSTGPLILIANHPFGVIDGLILGNLLAHHRTDFSLIVNEVLTREKMIKNYLLPIDFRKTKDALQTNISTRKKSMENLLAGKSLGIFPSGGVATTPKITNKEARDLEWKRFVVKIILTAKPTIVPIYFHGQNSKIFQWASHVHPNLRLGLLMHEATNKMNSKIKVDINDPIKYDDLPKDLNRTELLDYLKAKTIKPLVN